jgi:hypothetical protein
VVRIPRLASILDRVASDSAAAAGWTFGVDRSRPEKRRDEVRSGRPRMGFTSRHAGWSASRPHCSGRCPVAPNRKLASTGLHAEGLAIRAFRTNSLGRLDRLPAPRIARVDATVAFA